MSNYLTIESVTASLNDANWAANGDGHLSVMLANAWLAEKRLPSFEIAPPDVLMAGALIAQSIAKGEMYQGRTEGVVVSKSVKAGDVSSSKTYASGTDGEPISQAEQQALLLLAKYLVKTKGYRQARVERA